MAGTEIANAYVALTVRAPGIANAIKSEVGGSAAQSAMTQVGSGLGQKLTNSINGVIKGTFKAGVITAAGVAIAGIGTALSKGFQRLDAIDTAQAKLRGLGHDAGTVDTIMSNALASVKGTAFGLGDAATVAAQAVAAGIKPGKELEGVLSTVANTAAAAGTDLGDMGSIFAKAMSQANGVQNDVIGQLADKGIPIYQALADQLGVTSGEVFKLASSGKINFEQFAAAAQAAGGTVASEMGGTWSGLWDNALAAAGRFGEKVLGGVFPQLKDGLSGLTEWIDSVGPVAEEMGAKIGDFVADAIPKLIDGFKVAGDVIMDVFGWMKANSDWLIPLAVAVGTLVAGIWAWVNVTNALKAAQVILNAVMAANPLGAILLAVTALVAGLVWFFSETKVGKQIWGEFTRFLGEAWANISAFFTAAWENVIQPVFQAIGEVANWLWQNVLSPVFGFIGSAVGVLAAGFKFNFDMIVTVIRVVAAIVQWLWANAVQPALNAIGTAAGWLYQNAIKPAFDGIGLAIKVLGGAFTWIWQNIVTPVWQGISNAIGAAWSWIDAHVFSPMKTGIDAVGKAFDAVGKFIGEVWTRIQDAAKAPVKFLINTVWNDGIRSFAVDVLKALGLNDLASGLPRVSMPFAQGGVLPGYTPGRDVHEFYSPTGGRLSLSGGEAIMRPEFTRMVGGAAGVARLNMMARRGQAFKNGGVWDEIGNFAGDAWDNIKGAASAAWDFISDPAGAVRKHMSGFLSGMGGNGAFSEIVAGVPKMFLRGFEQLFANVVPKSSGTAGMGWKAMQDIVLANIKGARITSAYRSPVGNAAVGGAKGSYHMQGRAIDIVPASMATFDAVRRLFPNAAELIYTPAGAAQLRNGQPFAGWSSKVKAQHHDHVHLAMANGGVVPQLYDQGGWLPHGGIAVNRSGKPEPVLTNDQWQMLGKGGPQAGDRLYLVVDDQEFSGYVAVRAAGVAASQSRERAWEVRSRRRGDA